jgi:hypothetical protein
MNILKRRSIGVGLFLVGVLIVLAYLLVPLPDFDELERRVGVVEDARDERIWFCRQSLGGDCAHTVVQVRHDSGVRNYNFAQTDADAITIGEEIVVWVAQEIRGLDRERLWHAEQGGRVVRDYEKAARADRKIIGIMVPLAPFLIFIGLRLARRYDWQGNPVEERASTSNGREPFSDR